MPDPTRIPALMPLREAMDDICGGQADAATLAAHLRPRDPRWEACRTWFTGLWLEDLVSATLQDVAASSGITDLQQGQVTYHPRKGLARGSPGADVNYELDAAAVRGYQLFALSCKSVSKKGAIKPGLLEIFVRARQLGGDEARGALVCLCDDVERQNLMLEVQQMGAEAVKIFGVSQLPHLSTHLRNWIAGN